MTSKRQTLVRLGLFLLISLGLTWGTDLICMKIWGFEKWLTSPYGAIVTLTMFSPMLANILTRLITKEGFGNSKLHLNLRGNIRYYLLAYLIPAIAGAIIAVIVNTSHGNWRFEALEGECFSQVFIAFMDMCVTPLFYYSFCCFGEEFGWRGYMNDKLEELTGTGGAVVLGGVIWGLWHVVLVAKGYNFGPEHPVLGSVMMCVSCVFLNAAMMWLTKKTDSVFPAVLLHIAMDMGLMNFILGVSLSGISEKTADRVTEFQSGVLQMVIPMVIIGTVFLILLLRDRSGKPGAY